MRELNNIETRNVCGALYQPEPWSTNSGGYRNPRYVYWDAANPLQDAVPVEIERF